MKILLTNDDGIFADGILSLFDALRKIADVTLVAPDSERSAVGHGITIADPLRIKEFHRNGELAGHSCSGTPADCVKLAVNSLLDKAPDLVVSGINAGPNLGTNLLYSGTVSGAMEGAILGLPSVAVSLASWISWDFGYAAEYTASFIAEKMTRLDLPKGAMLNINIPPLPKDKIMGERFTFQSKAAWCDSYERRVDPGRRIYYWLTGDDANATPEEGSDLKAVKEGFVSITPLSFDLTDRSFLSVLSKKQIS